MLSEKGRGSRSVWIGERDDANADKLINAGLAQTFSDAVRVSLAIAARVVDRISATMKVTS